MNICVIQVPYTMGDERPGSSKGPERLVQAGTAKLIASKGLKVSMEGVDRGEPFRDSGNASLIVCKRLAPIVSRAIAAQQFPLLLAGGCDVSKGILSGFEHSQCGVVWFDAHGDFNTPETTTTGYFDGMSLAIVTGRCYRDYWEQIGNSAPISESLVLMLGVRDLDPAEGERLERSAVQVVRWQEGKPQADVQAALETLATRVPEVYLHIDMDSLDSQVAPGVTFDAVPGGLSLMDMEEGILGVFARFRVRAATLSVFNPDRDQDDKTLKAGLRIIEVLAEGVKRMG